MNKLNAIKQPSIEANDLKDVPPIGREMALRGEGNDARIRAIPQGPEKVIQAYRAAVSFMDAQVGRLLDALDASGKGDNTIIVFWGDNGWNHGEKQHWAKAVLWNESTKVPLIWVAPGVTQPGSVCRRPVDLLTVFPTLCDLTGLPVPETCQDPSIRPLLEDPLAAWDRPAVSTMGLGNHTVCDERWRYIRYSDGTGELYDHSVDPNEWTNLASDPGFASIVAGLAKWLPKQEAASKELPAPRKQKGARAER
jgi:arylsulfatase A-like enzyme